MSYPSYQCFPLILLHMDSLTGDVFCSGRTMIECVYCVLQAAVLGSIASSPEPGIELSNLAGQKDAKTAQVIPAGSDTDMSEDGCQSQVCQCQCCPVVVGVESLMTRLAYFLGLYV